MLVVRRYKAENKEIWNSFLDSAKNGLFMFNRNYMDYHADRFEDFSLLFYEEGQIIALFPASRHGKELRSHGGLSFGGFVTNERMKQSRMIECVALLRNECHENQIERVVYKAIPHIYHQFPAEEDLYALFYSGAKLLKVEPSACIDLQSQPKMSKGRKAQIVRAKREGVMVMQSNDFSSFITLENEVLSQYHNTIAVHTAEELELLQRRFPQHIKLYVALYKDQMIAGALVFEYRNIVHTQYLAANDAAREIGGLDYIVSVLIDDYRSRKRFFDFGISSEQNGLILNNGLAAQKESFGARVIAHQTFELFV